MLKKNDGYSLIEILIAMLVISIVFIPLMRLLIMPLANIEDANERTMARYLAVRQIEVIKNMSTMNNIINNFPAPVVTPAIGLDYEVWNNELWRTRTTVTPIVLSGSRTVLNIDVEVFNAEQGRAIADAAILLEIPKQKWLLFL